MSQHSSHAPRQLSGVGALMDPGYLRRTQRTHYPDATDNDDASLRGESWLIGGTAAICFYLALLACFA